MTNQNFHSKPDPTVCPKECCFHWRQGGGWYAPGLFDTLEEAFENLQTLTTSHCGCSFGVYVRLDQYEGDHDWYEPNEPQLEHKHLPWFYFIPTPDSVGDDLRDTYIRESEAYWGKQHWEM